MTVNEVEAEKEEEIDMEGVSGDTQEREFPNAFYDPMTGKIMVDPVVNAAGDSYDQSTVDDMSDQQNEQSSYYKNRALKSIIERELDLASNSMRGSIRRLDETLKNGWGRLVEQSAFAIEHRPLPPSYYCPITCELMVDPVISPEGYSYEHDAIENWIRANGVSPMTRSQLALSALRQNNALYDLIQDEKDRTDDSLHPSIRRWKDSMATSERRRVGQNVNPSPDDDTASADSPAQNLPTTHAQIRLRRRQRSRHVAVCGVCVILVTILVVLAVIPYTVVGVLIGISFWIGCSHLQQSSQ